MNGTTGNAENGRLPAATRVGTVALRVLDLDREVAFYEDVIGLVEHDREDGRAWLGSVGGPTLLELHSAPDADPRPDDAAGLFHVAYRVPDREALADALARIRERWQLDGASDHLVSEALYLTDPAGNGVEVYCDRPKAEWPRPDDGRGVEMATLGLDRETLADGDADAAAPAETDIGHVHLEVTGLADSEAFYRRLGMDVQARYGDGASFLAAGDYHHHVGINAWNGRTAPASGRGLAWFEVIVPDTADRDAAIDRLGVEATPTADGDALVVKDPDGIEIRLSVE